VNRPVRPATRWMRVVSMASASVMPGRIVVRRRASIDSPPQETPGARRGGQNAGIAFSFTKS
jgi:hypothetical protein